MDVLRTSDDRFSGLPGYDFSPHYADVPSGDGGSLRVHYLDEGPSGGGAVLLLHGEPSWSYLYRNVVPPLVEAGHRCVVPDLVGFGRSDKPSSPGDYTYAAHVAWMGALVFGVLDLGDVTLFGQDWGGLVGLRLVAAEPARFARVVVANTGLPTGDGRLSDAFLAWQRYARESPRFHVGGIVKGGCRTELAPEVVAAYDAPFPDDSFTAGARVLPSLVPTAPDDPAHDDNVTAWEVLRSFDRPFLCAFSDGDPITAGGDRIFRQSVPGAAGQPHKTIEGAGHFLQEDRPAEVARVISDLIAATPV